MYKILFICFLIKEGVIDLNYQMLSYEWLENNSSDLRPITFGLVMNAVPDHDILSSCRAWCANCKHKSGFERSSQQMKNLTTFSIVRQVCCSCCTFVHLTWIGMLSLHNKCLRTNRIKTFSAGSGNLYKWTSSRQLSSWLSWLNHC